MPATIVHVRFRLDNPMHLMPTAEPLPLCTDEHGVVRVGGTRVTLDTVVLAFRDGMSAEGIVEQYPSLTLADVYSVIGYLLKHSDEINAYLQEQERRRAEVRAVMERQFPAAGVRERLLSRKSQG